MQKEWLLASQFLSGLCPEIKREVTGSKQLGDIDQLLAKARFEEAKLSDLTISQPHPQMAPGGTGNSPTLQRVRFNPPPTHSRDDK